jgi:hypothetical protein
MSRNAQVDRLFNQSFEEKLLDKQKLSLNTTNL